MFWSNPLFFACFFNLFKSVDLCRIVVRTQNPVVWLTILGDKKRGKGSAKTILGDIHKWHQQVFFYISPPTCLQFFYANFFCNTKLLIFKLCNHLTCSNTCIDLVLKCPVYFHNVLIYQVDYIFSYDLLPV